jgi:hypothetical protein
LTRKKLRKLKPSMESRIDTLSRSQTTGISLLFSLGI